MDHIPSPYEPTHEPIRVPYLVKDAHTFDEQRNPHDFPSCVGLEIGHSDKGDAIVRSLASPDPVSFDDACSIVQSTYYFGFLHSIAELGGDVFKMESKLFITEDSQGNRYITSKYLLAFFDLIIQRVDPSSRGLSSTEVIWRQQQLNLMNNYLTPVREFLRICDDRGPAVFHHTHLEKPEEFFLASSIILSITLVAEQLSTMINILGNISSHVFRHSKILKDRLISSDWCLHAIATAERRFPSATVLYYLSRMKHGTADQEHTKCTSEKCMRSQLDESKYEQKHAPECVRDECFEYLAEDYRFQPPQTRRVSNLLKAGSTPQVILNLDGNIQLKTSYRYVAISHVWSDGLGNPHRNSLHSCQIGRIQRMVNDLYPGETESVPFWLDTLCVPLDPETRKLAISGMKQVYEQADRVLILDSDLIDAPYDMDIYETVMRVATCTWSTRLWTLQEAMFQSKTIYALPARPWTGDMFWGVGVLSHFKQFKLPQEQSEHVLQNSQIQKRAYLNLLLAWGTHVIEWQGKPFREFIEGIDVPADNTLSRIQSALNTRATSKIEDEPICLASLLGINPKKLFGTKDSASRMRHVFRSMKQIPTGFLFAPRPRIRDYGCRWMPQSLLWNEESTSYLGDYNQQAPVDQDGMLVTMPGIRFPHGLSPDDDDSRVITVELDGGELDGQRYEKATWEISFSFPKPESMKDPQQPWLACKGQDVAIVMSDLPGADWHGRRACILVAVRELSEEFVIRRMGQDPEMATRLFARYEACVKLKLSAKLPTRPNYHIGSGAYELLGKDQNWCIG